MDLHTAQVIYDNGGDPGTWYTIDPYHQAMEDYHEAENVLRDAGLI